MNRMRLVVCSLLLVACGEPEAHFEGTFLNADGSASANAYVRVHLGFAFEPTFALNADAQGRFAFSISRKEFPYPPVLAIRSSNVGLSFLSDAWMDIPSHPVGTHQSWEANAQLQTTVGALELSWQPTVDQENPVTTYNVRTESWEEDVDSTSVSIDWRKMQDFATSAIITGRARVWGDIDPSIGQPMIDISWRTELWLGGQTTSVPPSRGASCTILRAGNREPLNDALGQCRLTNGELYDNGSFAGDCNAGDNREVTIDLGAATTVNAVGILALFFNTTPSIILQLSTDGVNFTTVATLAAPPERNRFIELPSPEIARYVRLTAATGCFLDIGEVGVY